MWPLSKLPPGVVPTLGPDATALGQVFYYTLEAEGADLAQLRSLQDWYIRYQLQAVEGVSEVATLGGYVKQYQIDVIPEKLRAHRVTLARGLRSRPPQQHRRGGQGRREQSLRVLHPRHRLRQERAGHREHRHPPGSGHADLRQERGHGAAWPGVSPRHARQRRPRGGRRRRPDAVRREPAGGHRARQGEDRRDRAGPAGHAADGQGRCR